jgi:O-acetyl-ADP-ribose deacetylase (regulator of RNase III)
VAQTLGARTIAFPLISAGVYGWPADDAIRQAVTTIRAAENEGVARLVLFSNSLYDLAQEIGSPR